MIVVTPDKNDIKKIQEEDHGYYFSRSFEIVAEKHGYKTITIEHSYLPRDISDIMIITRETPWHESFKDNFCIFESPLHKSVEQALCIQTNIQKTDVIEFKVSNEKDLHRIGYSSFFTKKIPSTKKNKSEPKLFSSQDPFWNKSLVPISFSINKPTISNFLFTNKKNPETAILNFPFLDLAVFNHTTPELEDGYYCMDKSFDFFSLEKYFFSFIDQLTQAKQCKRVVWPRPFTSCFSIRHDFDRPVNHEHLRQLLDFYAKKKVKATWFWLRRTWDDNQVALVQHYGHEIALHTEARNSLEFSQEVFFFKKKLKSLKGFNCHGGHGSPGFIGASQYRWAIENDLQYGELLGRCNKLPHYSCLIKEGIPTTNKNFLIQTVHQSLDQNTSPDGHFLEALKKQIPQALESGEHCTLMNHPDIHINELKEIISYLDLKKSWCATLGEVNDWFLKNQK